MTLHCYANHSSMHGFLDIFVQLLRCTKQGSHTATAGNKIFSVMTDDREVRLNLSFVAKNYLYFFPERCDHKK